MSMMTSFNITPFPWFAQFSIIFIKICSFILIGIGFFNINFRFWFKINWFLIIFFFINIIILIEKFHFPVFLKVISQF